GDVDLFNNGALVEAGVTNRREIVQIGIAYTRQSELLFRFTKLSILNFQVELMYLELFNKVLRTALFQGFQSRYQFIRGHPLVRHNRKKPGATSRPGRQASKGSPQTTRCAASGLRHW